MLNKCLKIVHLLKDVFKTRIKMLLLGCLFQPYCILCQVPLDQPQALCLACEQSLPKRRAQYCECCGNSSWGVICGLCLQQPPAFDLTIAALDYQYPVNHLVSAYKYHHQLHLASLLAWQLVEQLNRQMCVLPDLIIAMPLYPTRLAQRGFNQSLELARIISDELHIPLGHACRRIKDTAPQAGLKQQQRIQNMRDAFICQQDMTGLRVALVDDVMTTGASMHELAKQLKQAGAAHVQCWVVARTSHQD